MASDGSIEVSRTVWSVHNIGRFVTVKVEDGANSELYSLDVNSARKLAQLLLAGADEAEHAKRTQTARKEAKDVD